MIAFLLACIGATQIINEGTIFDNLRRWLDQNRYYKTLHFIRCPLCVGFWSGVGFASVGLSPVDASLILRLFAAGCMSSGVCFAYAVLMNKMRS